MACISRFAEAIVSGETELALCIVRVKRTLPKLSHTNVIVINILQRYDLPPRYNRIVVECKKKLENICKHFRNTTVIDTAKLGRAAHTSHGPHLNHTGKLKLATDLCNTFRNVKTAYKTVKTLPKPIVLKWPDTHQLNSQEDGEGEEIVSSGEKENN